MNLEKVVSGGQTGVDRAGLDAAMEAGIPVGGWCPAGRLAEDGAIPAHYPLQELATPRYAARTEQNVLDADATLVLNTGVLADGTALTVDLASKYHKPVLVVQLDRDADVAAAVSWLIDHQIRVLNIAGPRESKCPGIYEQALHFMRELLRCR